VTATPDAARIDKAATLLLVRDAAPGLEVFMVERPSRGAFPELHVFTGGKVDATDADLTLQMDTTGPSVQQASEVLRNSDAALPYWLAAVRECYEESGVMLGNQQGRAIDAATLSELGKSREEDFAALCQRLGIQLELNALHYFAHWITPEVAPRRFDTRFFVARMPATQVAVHAPGETVSGEWVTAADALQRAEQGKWNMIMPTLTSLRSLLPYNNVDALLAAVNRLEHLPEHTSKLHAEGMQNIVPRDL